MGINDITIIDDFVSITIILLLLWKSLIKVKFYIWKKFTFFYYFLNTNKFEFIKVNLLFKKNEIGFLITEYL